MSPDRAIAFGRLAAINPMVAACNPLLLYLATIGKAAPPVNVDRFRADLRKLIEAFETRCRTLVPTSLPDEQVQAAKYVLCTALDEAVQRCAWGRTAAWAQRSLLEHFFGEVKGGETFFAILETSRARATETSWLLQLLFICLSLGYMGKYLAGDANGRQRVTDIRQDLYESVIAPALDIRGSVALSADSVAGLAIGAQHLRGFTAFGLTIAATLLSCLAVYVCLRLQLGGALDQVGTDRLAVPAVAAAPSAPEPRPVRPGLEQELRNEQVEMIVRGPLTILRVPGSLFDSGSAVISDEGNQRLIRIAAVLDTINDLVEVVGHTDGDKVRTATFPNNHALSLARARAVSELMRARLRDPARVMEARGLAADQPLVPEDSAANKARNRRVDIVLRNRAAS